jgi:hypothetical protein
VHAHAVGYVDRLLRPVDPDVDVQPEKELLAGHEAEGVNDLEVARPVDYALLLPSRERVRRRRADREALSLRRLADAATQVLELTGGLAHVATHLRRDLEHGLHQLGLHVALGLVRHRLDHLLDRRDQLHRLGVDDHQLLLDAERVQGPCEVMFHAIASGPA